MATTTVTIEINSSVEKQAANFLAGKGLTPSEFLRMALEKVAYEGFAAHIVHEPNAETIAAMEEGDRGEGTRYRSVDEMFADLGM